MKKFLKGVRLTGLMSIPLIIQCVLRWTGVVTPNVISDFCLWAAVLFVVGWWIFIALGVVLIEIPKLRKRLRREPIGLMGVADDGMLFTPSGEALFRVPLWLASPVQRVQHWVSTVSRQWAHPLLGVEVPGEWEGVARRAFQIEALKPVKKVSRYELALRKKSWLKRLFRF